MIRLVDSSAWIEWLSNTPLGSRLARQLPHRTEWVVPTIVQFEMYKWLMRETSNENAEDFLAFTQLCVIDELRSSIAIKAAELATLHKLSTADAIIYATALEHGADLLTCDAHFKDLPDVVYLAKPVN